MDMRGLEEKLAAANEQVGSLTLYLSAMEETARTQLAQKERELLLSTSELASVTKEFKAMGSWSFETLWVEPTRRTWGLMLRWQP